MFIITEKNTLHPSEKKRKKKCEKNRRFVDSGSVKTCDELVIRSENMEWILQPPTLGTIYTVG